MRRLVAYLALVSVLCASSAHGQVRRATASRPTSATFANLSTPTNGNFRWCSDCQATAPCTGGGTGAFAYRAGSAWNCDDHSGGGGSGDVVGPASATNNAIVRFDLTTGKLIQDSAVTVADTTGSMVFPATATISFGSNALGYTNGTGPTWGDVSGNTVTHSLLSLSDNRTYTWPDASGTVALTSSNVATATALAADPSDCAANNFATAIAASGNLTCVQPAFTDISGTASSAQIPNNAADTTGKSAKTDALNSATTVVNVSSATAPTSGQVLTATSDSAATWQTPSGGIGGTLGTADNAATRADGVGGSTAQGSDLTISDVASSTVTVSATTGNALKFFSDTQLRVGTATTAIPTADVLIAASATTQTPLALQVLASPTADWFSVKNSANTRGFRVQSDGGVIIDQATGTTFTNILDVKYQGTTQMGLTASGALTTVGAVIVSPTNANVLNLGSGSMLVNTVGTVGAIKWSDGGGPNGGASWIDAQAGESITLSTSGTTTDSTANLLPANSIIEAVSCRITTTITTATDWSVGDPTTAARFSSANSTLTAGTTSVGLNHMKGGVSTEATGPTQTTAAKLRITTTGTPGGGVVRCVVKYRQFVAPTS